MPVETQVDAPTRDWYRKKFGVLDDATLLKFLSVKSLFHLSNEDVYVKWESFVVTHEQGELDPSASNVEKFQHYLQEAIAASNQKKTPALKKVRDLAGTKRKPMVDFSSSPGVNLPSTPQIKKRKPTMTSEPDSSPSKMDNTLASSPRKSQSVAEANTVVESLNPHVEVEHFADSVEIAVDFESDKFKFRTMAMKLLESADVLDEQIDSVSVQLSEILKSSDVSLSNPCMSSQFDIVCCGRIVPDSPLYDPSQGQGLNDKSLFLETSRLGGIGQRVLLDLSQLPEYSFFPGQIVGLKGRNPTGQAFAVHEVLDLPELPTPISKLTDLKSFQTSTKKENQGADEYQESSEPKGTKVFVAAGPFSNQQNLNYEKLSLLVDLINTEVRPQVAILFGPFLDVTNKAVESGLIDFEGVQTSHQPKNLEELFKFKVSPILKKIDPSIQIILLPSLKEAVSKHMSYPQRALDRKKLGLPKNFKVFPNPSGFSVNEAMFGTSNMDVFKDLKDVYKPSFEGTSSKIPSNRFDRIATHVFQQKRYYPIFPGVAKKSMLSSEETEDLVNIREGIMGEDLAQSAFGGSCLEVPYLGLTEIGSSLPDVMLIPSEMKYFAKVVRGVVVINPGQFIRPNRDASREEGSYAVLSIKPADENDDENIEKVEGSEEYYHNIFKRCRVDMYKS